MSFFLGLFVFAILFGLVGAAVTALSMNGDKQRGLHCPEYGADCTSQCLKCKGSAA